MVCAYCCFSALGPPKLSRRILWFPRESRSARKRNWVQRMSGSHTEFMAHRMIGSHTVFMAQRMSGTHTVFMAQRMSGSHTVFMAQRMSGSHTVFMAQRMSGSHTVFMAQRMSGSHTVFMASVGDKAFGLSAILHARTCYTAAWPCMRKTQTATKASLSAAAWFRL